jgi:hypothetical protein
MKKRIILSITVLLFGCSSYQEITEQDVKDTILGMFDSFSVESSDKNNFYNYVTDDYVLYEMGKKFNASEFLDFASSFNTIEDDWELSNMKISIDKESAHAYFNNKGRFVTLNEGKKTLLNFEWLESAYMVRVDGKLKIKFYFSDTVNQFTEAIDYLNETPLAQIKENKMKRLLILLFVVGYINAQEKTFYLESGNIVSGTITAETDDTYVVSTSFGSLTIQKSDIIPKKVVGFQASLESIDYYQMGYDQADKDIKAGDWANDKAFSIGLGFIPVWGNLANGLRGVKVPENKEVSQNGKSEYESGYKKRIKEGRFKTNITTTCSLWAVTVISLGMAMGTL